ncbi:MAG: hypothetical protein KAI47_20065 [Deltaproteobacteria bacterium]|nr:hypothetical protein [Deltaproteobacteria bacterium]
MTPYRHASSYLRKYLFLGLVAAGTFGALSCSTAPDDPFEGATPLAPGGELGKTDTVGVRGLPVAAYANTSVWTVINQWEDKTTARARAAGPGWPQDSGLTWDQKFAKWIESLPQILAYESSYRYTFDLITPWGKRVPAPSLDCADVWIFLRATFAAWYQLPFYMTAQDSKTRIYFGHFGVRTAGGRWNKMPLFAKAYRDYTNLATKLSPAALFAAWPHDKLLRSRGTVAKDDQPFIADGARMGAYLDEIHLNKRAGHFIRLLLIYFGTPNLADSRNTFNLKADALREGDALLYRRARNGSGHTMAILQVGKTQDGKMTVEVASGNVPPRQPQWDSQATSKRDFTNDEGGGPSQNSLGETYSHLGGGLKRFRVAKPYKGYWLNTFMRGDEASWIDSRNYDAIGERPKLFESLLGEVPPKEKRQALLSVIDDARAHLRKYPASCAARERRENAFADLYKLQKREFYEDKAETDRAFRKKEDYVFAQLDYEHSKTCCWNSSNTKMFEVIMNYVESLESEGCACAGPPPVFKATGGGYATFMAHAKKMGLDAFWMPWSADETCPQAGVQDDVEITPAWTPYCDLSFFSGGSCPDAGTSNTGASGADASAGE